MADSSDLARYDHRRRGAPDAAGPVTDADLGVRYLARPAFATQLARGLDDREDAVHPGVGVRQTPAVGVHREVAAGRGALSGDERPALAGRAEAERLEGEDRDDRERVVELGDVDVRR